MAKKHHYVPVTDLRRFIDTAGRLVVYRKDGPGRPYRQRSELRGFETRCYSQTDDDGLSDVSSLKAPFSEIESPWLTIVDALSDPHGVDLEKGDFLTVPSGVRHNPVAREECWVLLIEPAETRHTGDEMISGTRRLEEQLS